MTRALREASRYLPLGTGDERVAFAVRQLEARRRFTQLREFYRANPCRMARIHLLTSSAVTLGRFCAVSPMFAAIGDELQPVDQAGAPRSEHWMRYRDACKKGMPWEVRDELWIAAHMDDTARARGLGFVERFAREAAEHPLDPTWRLLQRHMDMTLGARLLDGEALAGRIPGETAVAQGIGSTLGRLFRAGWALLGRYALETAGAILFSHGTPPGVASYRSTALTLLRSTITSWSAWRVYRRGTTSRLRGRLATGDTWPLLASVLGDSVGDVDPMVVAFYSNPSRFLARAELELRTWPARIFSFVLTLLVGQGLYETDPEPFDARFRVFARDDGSMHFVRELYPNGTLRVFDSDFIVREKNGKPTLFEVFVDDKVEVEMAVSTLEGGGLSIRGVGIFYRGVRLPEVGLEIEFQSRVLGETLRIEGHLRMRPRSRALGILVRGVLRRPEELGCIRYLVTAPSPSPASSPPPPSQASTRGASSS